MSLQSAIRGFPTCYPFGKSEMVSTYSQNVIEAQTASRHLPDTRFFNSQPGSNGAGEAASGEKTQATATLTPVTHCIQLNLKRPSRKETGWPSCLY